MRDTIIPLSRSLILLCALAAPAAAYDGPGLEVRGGVGAGTMLSSAQRDQGFRAGFVPDLRPAIRVGDQFAAELALASWFFPRDAGGTGRATQLGAGLRFDPRLTHWMSWFLDGHGGLALTGPANRLMVDAGTGVELWFQSNMAVGPFVRYGQVVDTTGPDPRFWAAGVFATMSFGPGSDEPPGLGDNDPDRRERQKEWERNRQRGGVRSSSRDRDGDGVVDEHDICPDESPGSNPDPDMHGCPRLNKAGTENDRDGDGVPDKEDKCPRTPLGTMPDPLLIGCPLSDKDQDGIPDLTDKCPNQPGSVESKGCPDHRSRR